MKSYFVFFLIPLLVGCRQNNMKQKELTTASVVRDTVVVMSDTIPVADTVLVLPAKPLAVTPPRTSASIMASSSKRFHVIVASQPTRTLAEKEVKRFRAKGYPGAQIIFKDGVHYRVSIASFPTRKEALSNLSFYSRALNIRGPWVTFF
jgi:hypothetical protein